MSALRLSGNLQPSSCFRLLRARLTGGCHHNRPIPPSLLALLTLHSHQRLTQHPPTSLVFGNQLPLCFLVLGQLNGSRALTSVTSSGVHLFMTSLFCLVLCPHNSFAWKHRTHVPSFASFLCMSIIPLHLLTLQVIMLSEYLFPFCVLLSLGPVIPSLYVLPYCFPVCLECSSWYIFILFWFCFSHILCVFSLWLLWGLHIAS